MKKKMVYVLLALVVTASVLASFGNSKITQETQKESTIVDEEKKKFTEKDLEDVVEGIDDHYILQDAKDIEYTYGIEANEDIVKEVKAKSKKVDLTKKGTYEVTYVVTVDAEKLETHLEEKKEAQEAEEKATSGTEKEEKTPDKESKPVKPDKKDSKGNEKEDAKDTVKTETKVEESKTEKEESKNTESEAAPEEVDKNKVEEKTEDKSKEEIVKETETSDEKESEETKKEDSPEEDLVDIEIKKEITVVDEKEAEELVGKEEEVWTDNNKPLEKEPEKKEEVKKEEPQKEETKKEEPKKEQPKEDKAPTQSSNQPSSGSSSSSSGSTSGGGSSTPAKPAHTHNWVAQTKTVHHDAVTQQVWVPCYVQVSSKTVCNGCGATITDIDHAIIEGASYHSEPIYEDRGSYQTQVISNAWDETVTTGYKCSGCGATK